MKTDLAIRHIVRQMEMDEHRGLKDLTPPFFFLKSNIKSVFLLGIIPALVVFFLAKQV